MPWLRLKATRLANAVEAVPAPCESATTLFMLLWAGVASKVAVNVPVCEANAVLTHPPPPTALGQVLTTGLTTSVTLVVRERLPLAPVIVNVKVPVEAELVVETLSVEVPEPLTEVGLRLAATPAG